MKINWNNFMDTLVIMWKGMLGIFVTVIIVMIVVFLLSKIGGRDKANK